MRPASDPFQPTGGVKRLKGNLGTGVMKVSAVAPERHVIEAPVRVFPDQEAVKKAFRAGEFTADTVVVVRFQGPKANGMPELHSLTPILAVLQDKGLKVALVTDGRMSGASGKVPSAIHVSPEALDGGPLARLHDGDLVRVDAVAGTLDVLTPGVLDRPNVRPDLVANELRRRPRALRASSAATSAPPRPAPRRCSERRPGTAHDPAGRLRLRPRDLRPRAGDPGDRRQRPRPRRAARRGAGRRRPAGARGDAPHPGRARGDPGDGRGRRAASSAPARC